MGKKETKRHLSLCGCFLSWVVCVALGNSERWKWVLSEKRSTLIKAFTIGFSSNLCSSSYVYYVMLGYFIALGVNWDFGVARDLVFGVLAGFSSDSVNFHSFPIFKFWLRFSFISRFINFRSLFARAGPLLMV